ncbi:MAG: glycosyltransferase family 9 protein [Candidatus Binatia bacterium]
MGKKILIVLHGSIGDVTRALPLANLLRRAYPDTRITWSIEPPAFPLVENHPAIDEVLVFERKLWWKSLGPFLRQIRLGAFDMVLDLQRHLKSGLISWLSGAPYRLGFHRLDSKEGNWIFNNRHIPFVGDGIPKLSHYLKFADFLGIHTAPVEWRLQCTPQEEERVVKRLQAVGSRFAVFFVGARWESKRWFSYQTALSATEVHRRYGLSIVLMGGEEDVPFAQELEGYGMVPLTNWVGKSSLREAIGILSRASVAVGSDSGLMHLSAAVGTPVVSLWGATSPVRTGPYGYENLAIRGKAECSPCYLRKCPIERICMQSIEIDEVVAKVGEALAQAGKVDGVRN